jgi:hypothetical protein
VRENCEQCSGLTCDSTLIILDDDGGGSSSDGEKGTTVEVTFDDGTSLDHTIQVQHTVTNSSSDSGSDVLDADGLSVSFQSIFEVHHETEEVVKGIDVRNITSWNRNISQVQLELDGEFVTNVNFSAVYDVGHPSFVASPVLLEVVNWFFKLPTVYEFLPGVEYTVSANSNKFTIRIAAWQFEDPRNKLVLVVSYNISSGLASECGSSSQGGNLDTSTLVAVSGAEVTVSTAKQALLDGELKDVSTLINNEAGQMTIRTDSFTDTLLYDPSFGLLFGGNSGRFSVETVRL